MEVLRLEIEFERFRAEAGWGIAELKFILPRVYMKREINVRSRENRVGPTSRGRRTVNSPVSCAMFDIV